MNDHILPEVVDLFYQTLGPDAWSLTALRTLPEANRWAIREGATVVAALAVLDEPDALRIVQIAVDPAHRRQGHARRLLSYGMQEARRRGRRLLVAEVRMTNTAALAFYRAMGFRTHPHALRYPDGTPGAVVVREVGE